MRNVPGTKYIRKCYNKFQIIKSVNGKTIYYGTYSTLIIALMIRDKFIATGWVTGYGNKYTNPEKHINITQNGKYRITRWSNGKIYYYGVYDTLREAQDVKIALEGAGWPYKSKYNKYNLPKYITYNPCKHYIIQKQVDDGVKNFGCFKTLKCAVEERDYLINHDWKYPDYGSIDDRVDNESLWLGVKINV